MGFMFTPCRTQLQHRSRLICVSALARSPRCPPFNPPESPNTWDIGQIRLDTCEIPFGKFRLVHHLNIGDLTRHSGRANLQVSWLLFYISEPVRKVSDENLHLPHEADNMEL